MLISGSSSTPYSCASALRRGNLLILINPQSPPDLEMKVNAMAVINMERSKARVIAFHLPQYHPIPENDEWWGKGFTEWTNTVKAKPLFLGHRQPNLPADLGFYDLRLPEARAAQASLAHEYGIEGFCYYHYWFAGRRLLERPVNEILSSGEPNFPFCLCWANQTWSGIWHGSPNKVLIEQTYPGAADHRAHFEFLIRAFTDRRYLTVNGAPLFLIYRAWEIPQVEAVLRRWKNWAKPHGLDDIHFLAVLDRNSSWNALENGFSGTTTVRLPRLRPRISLRHPLRGLAFAVQKALSLPTIYRYRRIANLLTRDDAPAHDYPCVIPNWDNTPRSENRGLVLHGATPALFQNHLKNAVRVANRKPAARRLVFLKSWNEWAEGNYVEPDLAFGRGWLEAIREEVLGY